MLSVQEHQLVTNSKIVIQQSVLEGKKDGIPFALDHDCETVTGRGATWFLLVETSSPLVSADKCFFVTGCISFTGLFSTTMRDLAAISNDSPKWIVLDGDIDPMWIESLNTVMDDNKVTKMRSFASSSFRVEGLTGSHCRKN